jgi:Transposase.
MKRSKHNENAIVKTVNQLDSGLSADAICREYGISRATLHNWLSKYSGMDSSHIKRLKELEEENRRLKDVR